MTTNNIESRPEQKQRGIEAVYFAGDAFKKYQDQLFLFLRYSIAMTNLIKIIIIIKMIHLFKSV